MSDRKMPWHHGFVTFIALLFYAAGALKFSLVLLHVEAFTKDFHPDLIGVLQTLPDWVVVVWGLCVWLGLIGAIMLLVRAALAPAPLFIAFVSYVTVALWLVLCGRPKFQDYHDVTGFYWLIAGGVLSLIIYVYARWERSEKLLGRSS